MAGLSEHFSTHITQHQNLFLSLVNLILVEASVKKPADATCTHTNTHTKVYARTYRILSAFTHTIHTHTHTHTGTRFGGGKGDQERRSSC